MANLKSIKKGDKVILRMFTGAFVEAKVVEKADAKTIGFTNKKGIKMTFSKTTGKQIEPKPKSEKFANFLDDYDEKIEKEELAKKARKTTKKPVKKIAKAAPEEIQDDDEEKIEDKPKKSVKKEAKKPVKKIAKKVSKKESVEEDEDFEEID